MAIKRAAYLFLAAMALAIGAWLQAVGWLGDFVENTVRVQFSEEEAPSFAFSVGDGRVFIPAPPLPPAPVSRTASIEELNSLSEEMRAAFEDAQAAAEQARAAKEEIRLLAERIANAARAGETTVETLAPELVEKVLRHSSQRLRAGPAADPDSEPPVVGMTLSPAMLDGFAFSTHAIRQSTVNQLDASEKRISQIKILQSTVNWPDFSGGVVGTLDMSGSVLMDPDFSNAVISDAFFIGSVLRQADFEDSAFKKASFAGAFVTGTDFQGATFGEVSFDGAILKGVEFGGADLRSAAFRGARMKGVSFDGAKAPPAGAFAGACAIADVAPPEGVFLPPCAPGR